jgi:hypothetical protein
VSGPVARTHAPALDVQEEGSAPGTFHIDADRRIDGAHRLVDAVPGVTERTLLLERAVELRRNPLPVEARRADRIAQRDALRRW